MCLAVLYIQHFVRTRVSLATCPSLSLSIRLSLSLAPSFLFGKTLFTLQINQKRRGIPNKKRRRPKVTKPKKKVREKVFACVWCLIENNTKKAKRYADQFVLCYGSRKQKRLLLCVWSVLSLSPSLSLFLCLSHTQHLWHLRLRIELYAFHGISSHGISFFLSVPRIFFSVFCRYVFKMLTQFS